MNAVKRDFRIGIMWAMLAIGMVAATFAWLPTARGADMAYKAPGYATPVYSWAGLYLEGYGLYAANTTGADVAVDGTSFGNIATSPHGPGIGGALGYNFQSAPGAFVLGLRVDLAWANIQGSGGLPAASGLSLSNATNWLGDADIVLGLPFSPDGRLLGYVNGGFAFGGAKPNIAVLGTSAAISDTATGWNLGAGLKYALTPNWSIGLEGDYYQLGDKQISVPIGTTDVLTSKNQFHIWAQKFVVQYKF